VFAFMFRKCIKTIQGYAESGDMIKEAEILKEFPSPYIIQYYDYFVENFFTCIVTEYCDVNTFRVEFLMKKTYHIIVIVLKGRRSSASNRLQSTYKQEAR